MSFTPFGRNSVVPTGAAFNYDTAVAADGSYYVAAEVDRVSPSLKRTVTSLLVTQYGANGRQVGATMTLSNYLVPSRKVSISTDNAGETVVVFQETHGQRQTLQYNIIANQTVTRASSFVTTSGSDDLGLATVAMDQAGGFYAGWVQNGSSSEGASNRLLIEHFAAGSSTGGAIVTAETPTSADFIHIDHLDLAVKPDGSGAVYAIHVTGSTTNNIRYGMVNATARTSHDAIGNATSEVYNPSVGMNADGSFEIAYVNTVTYPTSSAVVRFSNNGTFLSSQNVGNATNNVAITAMPGGGFITATIAYRRGVQTMSVTRFNANGSTDESGSTLITAKLPINPVLGADSAGNVVATYVEAQPNVVGPIHFQRFTSGIAVDGNELYLIGTNGNDVINTTLQGARIQAYVNGTTQTFRRTKIAAVSIGGLDGNDQLNNATNLPATIVGGAGNDHIQGGVDSIATGLTVYGEQLIGGDGNDTIFGSEGDDRIAGGDGDDSLTGNDGNDRIDGGNGRDNIDGNAGNDRIEGSSGSDMLAGGTGNDRISGSNGNDYLYGGAGNDTLIGGPGVDRLFGEEGNDTAVKDDQDTFSNVEKLI